MIKDIIKGLKCKYPLCCILQYAWLRLFNIEPADRLWDKFPMNTRESITECDDYIYVQCDKCMVKYLKRIRNEKN